jgi:hypothetical protein
LRSYKVKKQVTTPKTDELLYRLMGQIDKHRKTSQSVYEALWEMAKHARELETKLREKK